MNKYKLFGRLIFHWEMEKRRKINRNKTKYVLEQEFRMLEDATKQFKYPKNDFNKIMSMILSDVHLFNHVALEYKRNRKLLKRKTLSDEFYRRLVPNAKSYPVHPGENYIWNYNDNDNVKIEKLKLKLEKSNIHIYAFA